MSNNLSRRNMLIQSAMSYGSLSLRSLVTGLPAAFIASLSNPAMAQNIGAKYLVMAHTHEGDPVNANCPGSYPAIDGDRNDPLSAIEHPGQEGFRTPTSFTLGSQTVKAADPWSKMPADLRERFAFWHHPTGNSGHADMDTTLRINGAVKARNGLGQDQIDSALAQETFESLQCVTRSPISLGGTGGTQIKFEGNNVPGIDPGELQRLFGSKIRDLELMVNMRDRFIDQTYREIKNNGTPAQKAFLDDYAISREAATNVGDNLAERLDGSSDPANVTVALIQLNVSPLIALGMNFGRDNHKDGNLSVEVDTMSENGIPFLTKLWSELKRANLEDSVVYASLNVFGRNLIRNGGGGRNHNGRHHVMMVYGPGVKGGVVGGMTPVRRGSRITDFQATPINSRTGGTENPDISYDEAFVSCGKTLAKAAGISEDRINTRFDGGQIIRGALT